MGSIIILSIIPSIGTRFYHLDTELFPLSVEYGHYLDTVIQTRDCIIPISIQM